MSQVRSEGGGEGRRWLASEPVTRRLALAAAAVAAVSLFSACSTVDKPAATVNGTDISFDELETLSRDYDAFVAASAAAGSTDTTVATTEATYVSGTTARQQLTRKIRAIIEQQELAANGAEVTQSDIDAKKALFAEQAADQWKLLTPALQDFFGEQAATVDAFQATFGPSDDEAQALYEEGIDTSGVACASHILVETEAEAAAVSERLAAGDDFAEVAAELSQDPGSAANGGALTDPNTGSACTETDAFASSYVAEFVDAALKAQVGEPTEPFASQFGFHVLLLRPYADVAADAKALLGADVAAQRDDEITVAAKVSISPSIGVWDATNKLVTTADALSSGDADPAAG